MDTLQCAVVLAKLERFDWEIERRLEIGARYNCLIDERAIARVQQRPGRSSVFAQYTVLVEDRTRVQRALEAAGIPTAIHYPAPLNRQPAYADRCIAGPLPHSDAAAERVLSLPMHPYLDETLQHRIVDTLHEAVSARP
jgi:UDP-2-acetamido-2-deoxy-ribo-hexuluronate aminotransferase